MDSVEPRTFASFYDFYDGPRGRKNQYGFYKTLATEVGSPILELGSGTGLIAIELARDGHEVVGLDLSRDMLDVAEAKREREDASVRHRLRFLLGDMREFSLGEAFALVFVATNTLECLTENADHKRCLACALRHLRPGGNLVIEVALRTPENLARLQQSRGTVKQWVAGLNEATGLYTSHMGVDLYLDPVKQVIYGRSWIDEVQPDASVRRYLPSGDGTGHYWDADHYFTKNELLLLLEGAGFETVELWGDFDRSPMGASSDKMVVRAVKPAQ